nr:hypothetical protein [Tanacetum cinerariifolium]
MARLQLCDYHNMVAILEKSEHNVDFHPMVDFVEASPLRYALTFKPTVYVFHIRQFWSTARIEITEEGTKILATVDGIYRIVIESSLRRNIKLQDEDGISSLHDTELFENLTLMGYNISPNQKFTFQKGQFSHQWKYLIHTIMQCLSPKSTGFNEFSSNIAIALGKGSGTPTEPHHTPSHEAQPPSHTTHSSSSLPPVTPTIPTVTPSETPPIRQYTRRARIAQSGQGNQAKSSTLPHDSAPRVTSLAADEGTQEVKINRLKERVKLFEAREGVATERSGENAPIKGRSLDEGEAATERTSDDTKEMATVLTSMDAAIVLASGAAEVPTGSGSIPIAGPPAAEVPTSSDVVPTTSLVFATATVVTLYRRRKGKEVMVESDTPKKQKVQVQIDARVARELEEQLERGSEKSQQSKPWTKKQKRDYYMVVIKNNLGWKVKDFRGMAFEEVKAKFNSVWKQMEDFIPMGSKEKAERIKRKGLSLEQESRKKQKTSEELVPIEEVYIEALQVKHPIIDWKVHTEGQRSYWKITRLGGSSASYQFFIDLLKHLDREDLNQLWRLVKETLSNRPPTSDKEMELWVELSRLYEPDDED